MALDTIDFKEPICCFNKSMYVKTKPVERIPIGRVMTKLDSLYVDGSYDEAVKLINYWFHECSDLDDQRSEFALRNELIGIYRKTGNELKALDSIIDVLKLMNTLEISTTPDGATALVNCATAYKAFGKAAEAMPLFEQAKEIYEKYLSKDDDRLAGLYNNMALSLTDLEKYHDAQLYFLKALEVLANVKGSEPEQAISYLNIASLAEAEKGLEASEELVKKCIEKAWTLLNTNPAFDDDYKVVCKKCVSVFNYYGYIGYADELESRSK